MNRIHIVLIAVVVFGAALVGTVTAGVVDPRDVAFVSAVGGPETSVGGDPTPWASAGVVSQSDSDFLSRNASTVIASNTRRVVPSVGVVDGADYRLIAGDGKPGAACDIALVAAIDPGC